MNYPAPLTTLIRELGKLPGIGPKSAQRLAFYLFKQPEQDIRVLADALLDAKQLLNHCRICHNVTDKEICSICADIRRNNALVCVVEQPADVLAIERSGEFTGHYHVLHGVLSPMQGVGPADITIDSLLRRLEPPQSEEDETPTPETATITEIILATSTTVEGEATAMYLDTIIKEKDASIHVSRIAYGLPVGGDLEYADEVTLGRAIANRRQM